MEGTTTLGTGMLNSSGMATFTTSALSVAIHTISAVYSGDNQFAGSTAEPVFQHVDMAATTTALTSAPNPSVIGESVLFTATVTPTAPGAGMPTGTVSFMEGTTTLGTGTVSTSGQATFSTASLFVGAQMVTAVYSGDGNFTTSTSAIDTQTVNQASTTTALTSAPNPSVSGQAVMFTATVTPVPPGAGAPTGTVTFLEGTTTLGTGSVGANGQAAFTISTLSVGTHTVTASYSGDDHFTGSTSTHVTQTVNSAGNLQGTGVPVRAAEGVSLQNVMVANFTDTTGVLPATDYQATISWGDGTSSTGTVISTGTIPTPFSGTGTGGAFEVTGTHTYASEGMDTITVVITSDHPLTLTVSSTATVGGFVTQLYHDVLTRLPDPQGLAFWVGQLHAGLMNRNQVATSFWVSVEHRGLEVDQMYSSILHRTADPGGRAFWTNALLSGLSEGAVVATFLVSAEYTASHLDNTSYVVGLYHDVLARTASAAEIAGWLTALGNGSLTRTQVAVMFLSSNEAFIDAIEEYYSTFLGRHSDPQGLQTFFALAQSGQVTPVSLTAEFLGSLEYFNRALALAVQ